MDIEETKFSIVPSNAVNTHRFITKEYSVRRFFMIFDTTKNKEFAGSHIPDAESEANNMINEKMLVVKTIYDFKENERKAAMEASENRAKKQKILQILAEKKEGDLREKSAEELQEMLDSLD